MHWRPKQEYPAAWSAIGVCLLGVMVTAAIASSLLTIFVPLACVAFYVCLAPLQHWWPWREIAEKTLRGSVTAGDSITAGRDIEAAGRVEAGQNVRAGGSIRVSGRPQSQQLVATGQQRLERLRLGLVNPLVGHFRIGQFASPIEDRKSGCVFRVVLAPDCPPGVRELTTTTKDAFRAALSRSSVEAWGQRHASNVCAAGAWERANPNNGQIATFMREWGTSPGSSSVLWARATLQLPVGMYLGPRPILVLDVIEQHDEKSYGLPRLSMSLPGWYDFLRMLGRTIVDEIGQSVIPLVSQSDSPQLLGPNYEIAFGDRSLETLVEIPPNFEQPQDSYRHIGAEINTPATSDAVDVSERDLVIREGIQTILRNNGYDRIEDEVAKLAPTAEMGSA